MPAKAGRTPFTLRRRGKNATKSDLGTGIFFAEYFVIYNWDVMTVKKINTRIVAKQSDTPVQRQDSGNQPGKGHGKQDKNFPANGNDDFEEDYDAHIEEPDPDFETDLGEDDPDDPEKGIK
jgi:hypothetical protein